MRLGLSRVIGSRASVLGSTLRLLGLWVLIAATAARAAVAAPDVLVSGKVVDPAGAALSGAHVLLSGPVAAGQLVVRTDSNGRFQIPAVPPGKYQLEVLHDGYFPARDEEVVVANQPLELELTLHPQELKQTVDVVSSIYHVDPQETSRTRTLTQEQIDKVPFSPSYDIQRALAVLPGVAQDNFGRLHINGGASDQTTFLLDGFNITSPVTGGLENNFSIDSVRAADVRSSRYSAEYGKGSAGVIAITTQTGDDRFRYKFTDFIPSFDRQAGEFYMKDWAPRFMLSGPLIRNKVWFLNSSNAKYDLDVLNGLPKDANRAKSFRWDNLTRIQSQLGPSNMLNFSFLHNSSAYDNVGLDLINPMEATRDIRFGNSFFSVKDQGYIAGILIEAGFALNHLDLRKHPKGIETFILEPDRRRGNFFMRSDREAERRQWMANLAPRPLYAAGRHDVKFGFDVDRILYKSESLRQPYQTNSAPGVLWRRTMFTGPAAYTRNNTEWSGYFQDRWSPVNRFLLEAGFRFDRDTVIRQNLLSPRVAVTVLPFAGKEMKFSFGVGLFYDATNLYAYSRVQDQRQFDTFYTPDGRTSWGPAETVFRLKPGGLRAPHVWNWSAGWEQKLPARITARTTFLQKRGFDGFTFVNLLQRPTTTFYAIHELQNSRRDKYDAVEFTVSQALSEKARWMASYTRSTARTNAVLDYTIENPFLAGQGAGPMDWDMPNRFVSNGWFPLTKKFTFSWFMELRDGTPFSVINQNQELVGAPNRLRLPIYFSLNPHIEREVEMGRYRWALRVGINNITGHENFTLVNNNMASRHFLEYGGGTRRSFTFRVRYMGRSK